MTASAALRKRAEAVRKFRHDELKKHGNELRKALIVSAKAATGGDRRLSGLGSTPTLSVTLRTVQGGTTTTVTLKPSPKAAKGPWTWIQDGTRPGPRAMRRSVRLARGANSGQTRTTTNAKYHHPGTSGSNAWFGPVDRELPKIRAELRRQFNAISR